MSVNGEPVTESVFRALISYAHTYHSERCPTLGAPFATRCFRANIKPTRPELPGRATSYIRSKLLGEFIRRQTRRYTHDFDRPRLTPRWSGSRSSVRVTGLLARALHATAAQRSVLRRFSSQLSRSFPAGKEGTTSGSR